jgi:hypothetical protein
MRWREVQQIFMDAYEPSTFISRVVYVVICVEEGGSKFLLHGASSHNTIIFITTAMTT